MFNTNVNYNHLNKIESILICFLMACLYVFSLYVWSHENRYNRNSNSVIKRRFLSVFTTCLVCVLVLYYFSTTATMSRSNESHLFFYWIGLRLDHTLPNVVFIPLCLTAILFLGPIVQNFIMFLKYDSFAHLRFRLSTWPTVLGDLFWWRNFIISPFTEEFVFRACMLPLIVHNFQLAQSIFITPLFFGLAHLHHIIEGVLMKSQNLRQIILQHLFQFFYTYIFGLYSSYVYLRTANVFSCFVCHAFCNYMEFPNVAEIFSENLRRRTKTLIVLAYFLGLGFFLVCLKQFTEPWLYDNRIFS